jgi:hypothetical protein
MARYALKQTNVTRRRAARNMKVPPPLLEIVEVEQEVAVS